MDTAGIDCLDHDIATEIFWMGHSSDPNFGSLTPQPPTSMFQRQAVQNSSALRPSMIPLSNVKRLFRSRSSVFAVGLVVPLICYCKGQRLCERPGGCFHERNGRSKKFFIVLITKMNPKPPSLAVSPYRGSVSIEDIKVFDDALLSSGLFGCPSPGGPVGIKQSSVKLLWATPSCPSYCS